MVFTPGLVINEGSHMVPFRRCQLSSRESILIITRAAPLSSTHSCTVDHKSLLPAQGLHLAAFFVDPPLAVRDYSILGIREGGLLAVELRQLIAS